MRSAARICLVRCCGNIREGWASTCRACFRRLPVDLVAAIGAARAARSPLQQARARTAAVIWLNEHPPGWDTARLLGEASEDLGAPP